jgi:hypothetical protein
MQSNSTLENDLNVLSQLQGVLYSEDEATGNARGRPAFEPLGRFPFVDRDGQLTTEQPVIFDFPFQPLPGSPGVFLPVSISEVTSLREGAIEDLLASELGIEVGELLAEARGRTTGGTYVAEAVADFGTEAFATYLPWHMYARSRRSPWGMYFYLEPIVEWAADMQKRSSAHGLTLDDSQALRLAFFACYRHELFHFHVESFCVRQEVLTTRPVYRPYDRNVFQKTANTDQWLEEALAQAVVL